jgi:MarR family 2-MHQ and catechol resistance regulon transcriptional repressor
MLSWLGGCTQMDVSKSLRTGRSSPAGKVYDWDKTIPALDVWWRLRQVEHVMERALQWQFDVHGITPPQIDILMILSVSRTPLTPSDIAAYVFRERHSISELLTRMQKAGYVKKVRSKKDKRFVTIRMLPKAKELWRDFTRAGLVYYSIRIVKSALSEEEIRQLDELLKKLRDNALQELGLTSQAYPFDTLRAPRVPNEVG